MTRFFTQQGANKCLNKDGVLSFFAWIGGEAAAREVRDLLARGDFLKPAGQSHLDGAYWWRLRDLVGYVAARRPTSEMERALGVLRKAEARACAM
jgi:hypothetical protein